MRPVQKRISKKHEYPPLHYAFQFFTDAITSRVNLQTKRRRGIKFRAAAFTFCETLQ
jgi:hypothetical protein